MCQSSQTPCTNNFSRLRNKEKTEMAWPSSIACRTLLKFSPQYTSVMWKIVLTLGRSYHWSWDAAKCLSFNYTRLNMPYNDKCTTMITDVSKLYWQAFRAVYGVAVALRNNKQKCTPVFICCPPPLCTMNPLNFEVPGSAGTYVWEWFITQFLSPSPYPREK